MTMLDPRTWLEILPEQECWRLLRLSSVARVALIAAGEPAIWPLNVAVDGRTVIFRTGPGTKLASLDTEPRVAFEVDGLDFDERRGWSVIGRGRVHPLAGSDLTRAQKLPLAPWTVGDKPRWFGIDVDAISGRSIGDRAASTTGASRPR